MNTLSIISGPFKPILNNNNENVKIQTKIVTYTNKNSNLAYAPNTLKTVTVKKGQYMMVKGWKKIEDEKKKEDMMSEGKRDDV